MLNTYLNCFSLFLCVISFYWFQEETTTAKPPKNKDEGKSPVIEKPRQLFWEKRLSGIRASYPDEQYEPVSLPNSLKPVGPGVEDDVVLASISTSLHLSNGAISGQSNIKVGTWYTTFTDQ